MVNVGPDAPFSGIAMKLLGIVLAVLLAATARAGVVDHRLSITLEPEMGRISVSDTVTLDAPPPPGGARFTLHGGLNPRVSGEGATLAQAERLGGDAPWAEAYLVKLPEGARAFTLEYGGVISHSLEPVGKEYARGFSATPGIISAEGVVLSGASRWFSVFGDENTTFTLTADLPKGWDAVSQGGATGREEAGEGVRVGWRSESPGDEIWLIAGKFHRYSANAGKVVAEAYLRAPDVKLATRFLDATGQYIEMYEKLIGPYPFTKFALVENFWETGFGMPSFTLLGPKVIRFPFILRSSYPHEILHNWWGNGVYVDYPTGNWSEGLTAYLADHLMREQQGAGHEYREATLQKYGDFVADKADAPLTTFVSRHSSSTEALGYGKSLMVFHMLRKELGDEGFRAGLARFYGDNLWKRASWGDLRSAFEKTSGRELGWYFAQWVERSGAPTLALEKATISGDGPWRVTGRLRQTQGGEPYRLKVQVAVTLEGRREARVFPVEMVGGVAEFSADFEVKPLRVDIDPFFDLFRLLGREETPPAISGALGASPQYFALPSASSSGMREAWRGAAEYLGKSSEGVAHIVSDADPIPADAAVWVLGWENALLPLAQESLAGYPANLGGALVELGSSSVEKAGHTVVATGEAGNRQVTFVASDNATALPGLSRKLPHYGKYSYLAFEGEEPVNVAKGRWDAAGSKLSALFVEKAVRGAPPAHAPLAALPPVFSRERMVELVNALASPELKGRGAGTPELDRAAGLVAAAMKEAGLKPGAAGSWFSEFTAPGENGSPLTLKNIVGVVEGTNAAFAGQSVVVGAHYDHLGLGWPDARKGNRGAAHPGADDNASGVAVMVELARRVAQSPPERSVVFVAFAGEEMGRAGSKAFLSGALPFPKEKILGMVNLDTVGRLGDGKILFLGASSAREWIHIANGAGFVTGAKVEAVSKDIGSSDQTSFIEEGIPAVQVFTGAHADYHSPGDTPDRIDAAGLTTVAQVAFEAVDYLAGREGALTSNLSGAPAASQPPDRAGARRVSLGTVPDFAYTGEGVRVAEISPESPAQVAGLAAGDVIIGLNGAKVADLKGFSEALKKLAPGDRVTVDCLRGGVAIRFEAVLAQR